MRSSLLLALALSLGACAGSPPMNDATVPADRERPNIQGELMLEAPQPNATIVANAAAQPQLSMLVAAVQRAGLVDALNGAGPFTVFAPIDDAWDGIDIDAMSVEDLQAVLKYHVVSGKTMASDLREGDRLVTLAGAGQDLTIGRGISDRLQMTVDGASIVYGDIPASNGVIHLVNTVLMPESGGDDR